MEHVEIWCASRENSCYMLILAVSQIEWIGFGSVCPQHQIRMKGAIHRITALIGVKTRSRRDYGPADFGSLQTEASVKLTPLAAFLIFIKKTMWPF